MANLALVWCSCATVVLAHRHETVQWHKSSNSALHIAEGTSSAPSFRPEIFKHSVKALSDTPVEACAGPLFRSVLVNDVAAMAIQAEPHRYFHLLTPDRAWEVAAADSQRRDKMLQEFSGHGNDLGLFAMGQLAKNLGFPVGLEVVRIGEEHAYFSDMDTVQRALARHTPGGKGLMVSFHAGFDFRNCWGNLHDLSDQRVCGPEVMSHFLSEVPHLTPKVNATGQSGSTIVTNLRDFIVKNAKNEEEVKVLFDAAPQISQELLRREEVAGSCWSTALAPICAVIFEPGVARWMAMRKIAADGERRTLNLKGDQISVIDLKSPKFTGYRDGKTAISKSLSTLADMLKYAKGMWKGKDAGFAELFKQGVHLSGCGSRDAQITFMGDASLLASLQMTDYSFFGAFYEDSDPDMCICDTTSHPRFPVLLSTSPDSTGNEANLRIAAGIVDWLEQEHKSNAFSTMKAPELYRQWYSQMWGLYFHVPPRGISVDPFRSSVFYIDAVPHQPREVLAVGDIIFAIQKMKWKSKQVKANRWDVYSKQLQARSARSLQTGSAFKVEGGELGKVVDGGFVDKVYVLIVEWDSMPNKLFTVFGHQVVGQSRKWDHRSLWGTHDGKTPTPGGGESKFGSDFAGFK